MLLGEGGVREKRGGREKTSKQKGEREGERLCVCVGGGREKASKQAKGIERGREGGRREGRGEKKV